MWKSWSDLDNVLKTGKPYRGERNHEAFILGMHNLSSMKAREIIKEIDLGGKEVPGSRWRTGHIFHRDGKKRNSCHAF